MALYKNFPIVIHNFEDLEDHLIMKLLEYRNLFDDFDQNIKLVRCLLERSNIFGKPSFNGKEFMEKAVRNNDIELCKMLFDLGANFNFTKERLSSSSYSGTFTLFTYAKSPEMIESLLDCGVKITENDIKMNKFLKEYLEIQKRKQRLSLARVLETFGPDFDTIKKVGETYTKSQKGGKKKRSKKNKKTKKVGKTYKKSQKGKSKYSKKK